MSYQAKVRQMYDMIDKGQAMEALDQYYHEDVVVIDGLSEPRNGKEAQRKALAEWFGSVKDYHGSGVSAITANEDEGITTVESWTEITFQDGSKVRMEEIGVQKWEGDKIIHERFYYSIPPEMQQ
ncbi:MAG: nuclear transport factor 2 family protein [Bacteroidota bacterium]